MSTLSWLLVLWGVVTAIFVLLLIYRGTLTIHEEDQLFLDEAESQIQAEQMEVVRKVQRLNPFVRAFGTACGVLLVVIFCVWLYQGLFGLQYVR